MQDRDAGPREAMSLRIAEAERRRIDQAAGAAGMTRTGFMLAAALEKADAVLYDRVHLAWDAAAMEAFRAVLDAAPAPAPRATRAQAWKP